MNATLRVRFLAGTVLAGAAFLLCLAAVPAPPYQTAIASSPANLVLSVNPEASRAHWSVDSSLHTVHGSFAVKKGMLRFDRESGEAAGEVVVAASSGQSGNHSRDARMHKEILETEKYPDAVFRPTQIEGKVAASGPSDVKLHGVLSLHGSDHPIVAQVHAELSGNQWKGTATFDVPYTAWGMKDASNFFLKVKHNVSVELDFAGTAAQESKAGRN